MIGRLTLILVVILTAVRLQNVHAAERVDIVIDKDAPQLEKVAAQELSKLLPRLFHDVTARVEEARPDDSKHTVLVGSPDTNSLIKHTKANLWPTGDQTIVIRTQADGTLVIGGGSPAATLWAVHEFGYQNGVRYTLTRDLFPLSKRDLELREYDITAKPLLRDRRFQIFSPALIGLQTMTIAEQNRLLTQLSKMRFNGVLIEIAPWQPFVAYEFGGVTKTSAELLAGIEFEIDSDTVGKKALRGMSRFEHPHLTAGSKSSAERIKSGTTFLRMLTEFAHGLGMNVTLRVSRNRNPREFESVLPGAVPQSGLASLSVGPPADAEKWDDAWAELFQLRTNALVTTYPNVDRLAWVDESRANASEFDALVSINRRYFPGLSSRVQPVKRKIGPPDNSCPKPGNCRELLLPLSTAGVDVLPQSRLQAAGERMTELRAARWRGFVASADALPEMDVAAHLLSRSAWEGDLTPRQAHDDIWSVATGNASASERLWIAWDHLEKATTLVATQAPDFATPAPDMLMQHYQPEPAPEWWETATTHYTQYLIELYRAHGAINGDAKPLLFYSAKRAEFVVEYMTTVQAVRAAAIASEAGDTDLAVEKLGEAVETLYNCINTLSDVARDPSDRAVIAVLNKFAFQPLLAKLELLEQ